MKVEPRGKYPGVKIHLDAEETTLLMDVFECLDTDPTTIPRQILKKIKCLMEEEPNLLTSRTPEQIAAALKKEEVAAREKQKVLAAGQDWTKVKVNVEVEK